MHLKCFTFLNQQRRARMFTEAQRIDRVVEITQQIMTGRISHNGLDNYLGKFGLKDGRLYRHEIPLMSEFFERSLEDAKVIAAHLVNETMILESWDKDCEDEFKRIGGRKK